MSDFPWLTTLILIPIVGGAVLMFLPRVPGAELPKQLALSVSVLTLGVAVAMILQFDPNGGMQFTETHEWIKAFGAHYALGVDGLGVTMVGLTTVLVPIVILASWPDADEGNTNVFFALMLILEGLALAVFTATDVLLFYVVFEATLIPAYFLVGGFGRGKERSRAAVKFLVYMLAGGLIMLASVVGLYAVSADAGSPSYLISDLSNLSLDTWTGRWLFVGFFIAFAIKCPLFPVHTWLSDTTASATPGTSVLLVCILDKIGTYGMLRFCLELFPEASEWATPFVVTIAVISIIYGALVAIGQDDMLRLIGLTSLSHFGFIVLGIFVLNSHGTAGAILYMVNHGLATTGLFLIAGYLIRRRGTASISATTGVEKAAPVLAGLFLVCGLATLGLPGLSPFVSEFLVLVGSFDYGWYVGALAVTGIVLAAVYVLLMYQRTMTGPTPDDVAKMPDLSVREIAAVGPVVVAMVVFGFFPQPLLDVINPVVDQTMERVGVTDQPPAVSEVPAEEAHE